MRNIGLLGCIGVLLLVLLIFGGYFISARNHLVALDEGVNQAWAQVESQYQRRYDLIPNLVQTVQGAANFEKSTLEAVVNARARVGQVQMAAPTDPAAFQQFEQAQGALTGALQRLLVVVEQYPDLKSNRNFLELQSQLEGTENRIAVARNRYIATVKEFNVTVREFPTNLTAGMFGFDVKPNFSVQNEAAISTAPAVTFDTSTPAQSATPVEGSPSPAPPPPAN